MAVSPISRRISAMRTWRPEAIATLPSDARTRYEKPLLPKRRRTRSGRGRDRIDDPAGQAQRDLEIVKAEYAELVAPAAQADKAYEIPDRTLCSSS